MILHDIAIMALGNLWSQKIRTALNLLGVIISAVLLMMTLAGTRGASDGVMSLINSSAQTRQFMIIAAPNRNAVVPTEELAVRDTVNPDRKQRLQKALRKSWINANAKRIMMDASVLETLRDIKHVAALTPQGRLNCLIDLQDDPANTTTDPASTKHPGSLVGARLNSDEFKKRLVAGSLPTDDDPEGVLLNELTAWKMGHHNDPQIASLVGKRITVRFPLGKHRMSNLTQAIGPAANQLDMMELAKLASAFRRLSKQIDVTRLSPEDKELIRQGLTGLTGALPNSDATPVTDLPDDEEVDAKGNRYLIRSLVIRGIVRNTDKEDATIALLQFAGPTRLASLYSDCTIAEAVHSRRRNFKGFYTSVGEVDHVSHLAEVIGQIEAMGLRTRSAVTIIEKLQSEVGKMHITIGAAALLILMVAAIGISNTMIIAVLERTPEFGIMKSLGSTDRQILALVLCEGMMIGLLGAVLAFAISLGLAEAVCDLCRSYIESRIKGTFDQPIFRFAVTDVAVVFFLTGIVCMLASLFPAWRAARLDPVDAMRR